MFRCYSLLNIWTRYFNQTIIYIFSNYLSYTTLFPGTTAEAPRGVHLPLVGNHWPRVLLWIITQIYIFPFCSYSKTGYTKILYHMLYYTKRKGTVLFVDGWFSVNVAPLIWKHSNTDRKDIYGVYSVSVIQIKNLLYTCQHQAMTHRDNIEFRPFSCDTSVQMWKKTGESKSWSQMEYNGR